MNPELLKLPPALPCWWTRASFTAATIWTSPMVLRIGIPGFNRERRQRREKFFGNSFAYFAWFAVKRPRRAGEMCGDKKINFHETAQCRTSRRSKQKNHPLPAFNRASRRAAQGGIFPQFRIHN